MLSKEEIEKAKEFLWDIDDYLTEHSIDENGNVIDEDMNEKATKINNANYYIEQLEQENKTLKHTNKSYKGIINKLNKMIDEMAGYIATLDIDEDICSKTQNEDCDKMSFGECESCIKKHFEKKVEGK